MLRSDGFQRGLIRAILHQMIPYLSLNSSNQCFVVYMVPYMHSLYSSLHGKRWKVES